MNNPIPVSIPPGFVWTAKDKAFCQTVFRDPTWNKMLILYGFNRPKIEKSSTESRAMSSAEAEGWENGAGFLMNCANIEVDAGETDEEFNQIDMNKFDSSIPEGAKPYDSRTATVPAS